MGSYIFSKGIGGMGPISNLSSLCCSASKPQEHQSSAVAGAKWASVNITGRPRGHGSYTVSLVGPTDVHPKEGPTVHNLDCSSYVNPKPFEADLGCSRASACRRT